MAHSFTGSTIIRSCICIAGQEKVRIRDSRYQARRGRRLCGPTRVESGWPCFIRKASRWVRHLRPVPPRKSNLVIRGQTYKSPKFERRIWVIYTSDPELPTSGELERPDR